MLRQSKSLVCMMNTHTSVPGSLVVGLGVIAAVVDLAWRPLGAWLHLAFLLDPWWSAESSLLTLFDPS